MTADRQEAKRSRAAGRERRRKAGEDPKAGEAQSSATSAAPTREQALEQVKHAAKVAAASAAVGAAIAAARALATRDGESEAQVEDRRPGEGTEARADGSEPDAESAAAQHEPESQSQTQADESHDAPQTADRDEGPSSTETDRPSDDDETESEPKADEKPLAGAAPEAARSTVSHAKEQLESLLGRTPESVSSLERTRDGWLVTLEVVDVARIPESTDVLASYEMELDDDGNLRRYGRVRRYRRSQIDNGEGS